MRRITKDMTPEALHLYLYEQVPSLKHLQQNRKDLRRAAFVLRDWVSALCSYPGRTLLLKHNSYSLPALLLALQDFKGGVWCGGCSLALAGVLRACQIPAGTYGYGWSGASHYTTIFSPDRRENWYILDCYVNYHYAYKGSSEMIPMAEMFHFIKNRQYDEFRRVDTLLRTKHLVTAPHETAKDFAWLFDDGPPEKPDKVVNQHRVYSGVSHTVDKLLQDGCLLRVRIDEDRGEQDLNEYMLDLMLVNPDVGRAGPAVGACYPDISVLRYFVRAFANTRPW